MPFERLLTSSTYAITAAIALVLYTVGARLAGRYGAGRVYRWSLALRFVGFLLLLSIFYLPIPKTMIALLGFALIILAWPLQSIAGMTLTARLTPFSQGSAMGLFNASGAIATVLGTFLGGPLVAAIGYPILSIMALGGILLGWLSGHRLQPEQIAQIHMEQTNMERA